MVTPGTRERILAALMLLVLVVLQLAAIDGFYLLSKYFWIDELYTYAVVADPSLAHALRAIEDGIDNMPVNALLMRVVGAFVTNPAEVFLRSYSLGFMMLALIGVYVLLRRAVSPLAAVAGALTVWAHPLTLAHAFDARFYAPFMAASVWFCFVVDRRLTLPLSWRTGAGLALAALGLCAIHMFGILVWGIVLAACVLVFRRVRPLWPALAGPAVLPVLWWLVLGTHRAVITVPTWENPFSWSRVAETARFVLLPDYVTATLLLIWGVACIRLILAQRPEEAPASPPAPSFLLLTSLVLLLPAVVVVSLLVQPALTPRYSMVAIAALAPPVAWSAARLPRWGTVLIIAVLIAVSTNGLRRHAIQARWQDQQIQSVIAAVRDLPGDDPVVFEVTHVLDVIWRYAPDLRSRVVLLDFETSDVPGSSQLRIVSRDLARLYRTLYEAPRYVRWSELRSSTSFYLAPDRRAYSAQPSAEDRYPDFTIAPLGPHLAVASRR